MSKRYGRQQKRQAKAKIEALQFKNNELETLMWIKNRKIATAEYVIEIARKICPNSVCFEPQQIGENIWRVQRIDVPIIKPDANQPIELSCIDLYQLEIALSESGFAKAVHYEASLLDRNDVGKRAAYRISLEGFNVVPVDHIISELAGHLKRAT